MITSPDQAPHISVVAGILVGLAASFVQSLGLTIQRKSHLLNEALPLALRKKDRHRPLWVGGFTIFICSNLLGTIFQIGALPIVVLGPLGAVSLLYNAFFAKVILGDSFSLHLILGTILIAGGAVLIGIFGVVPEETHSLDELILLYSRPAFIIWISLLSLSVLALLSLAHITEWRLERRLRSLHERSCPPSPSTPSRRGSLLWRNTTKTRRPLMSSPNVAKYGTIETGSVVEVGGRLNRREEGEDSRAGKPLVIETDFGSNVNWDKIQSTKLLLGLAYGIASGTLSGLCLLFAKTGIDLLILTVIGHNQFGRIQAWLIVFVLVVAAILQLIYLNRALRLVGPTLICPLAFCFYNLCSILSGLIYFDQWNLLSGLQIGLVSLGTVILLSGVWIVSIKVPDHQVALLEEGRGEGDEMEGSIGNDDSEENSDDENAPLEWVPSGFAMGLSSASPGFAISPSIPPRRQSKSLTTPSRPLYTPTSLADEEGGTDPNDLSSATIIDLESLREHEETSEMVRSPTAATSRRMRRGASIGGALYVGRLVECETAPSLTGISRE